MAEEKVAILTQIYQRLMELHEAGRKAVVLIDEANMLQQRELMEELRGFLNLEVPGSKLITFILFGLPSLDAILALDTPLTQRVAVKCRLSSLSPETSKAYIRHRLKVAGATREIFAGARAGPDRAGFAGDPPPDQHDLRQRAAGRFPAEAGQAGCGAGQGSRPGPGSDGVGGPRGWRESSRMRSAWSGSS